MRDRARVTAALGLLIALFLGEFEVPHWIAPGSDLGSRLLREGVFWLSAGIVVGWLVGVERLPLAAIGFRRPTWGSLVWAGVAIVLLVGVLILHYAILVPAIHADAGAAVARRDEILKLPLWFRALLVARAAVVEEVLYRGYMIEKVRQLSGSWTLGAAVSVAAFTYAHLAGWGLLHLLPVAAGGIVLAVLYAWRRDLPSNVLAHFVTDGMGFLLG